LIAIKAVQIAAAQMAPPNDELRGLGVNKAVIATLQAFGNIG